MHAYARGRLADSDGAPSLALRNYRDALAGDPDSLDIARRSYFQGLISGDKTLALRSAAVLDRQGLLPRDGTLLFLSDALGRKDWRAARDLVDRLVKEVNFAFIAPVIRSWISVGEGRPSPPVIDASDRFASLARRYVDEHLALQALARGDVEQGLVAINRSLRLNEDRGISLRLFFAAQLAHQRATAQALSLLPEGEPRYAKARRDLEAGRHPGAVGAPLSAAQGFGRLLARLAMDVSSDENTRILGIRLARIAAFANADDVEIPIDLAELLTKAGFPDYGIIEARKAAADRWFGDLAQSALVDALATSGDRSGAITLARKRAEASGDVDSLVQFGRLLADAKDFPAAAQAFRAARSHYAPDAVPWALLLLEGSALEQAGRWDEASTTLERAASLAPGEAVVLNYLGYAQIERRLNMGAAMELLKKASALKPEDASITDSLGWAQFVTGSAEVAVPVLERAAEGAPADATINEHLGDALWAVGRRFEARYAWRAAAIFAEGQAAARLQGKTTEGMKPEYAAP